MGFSYKHGKYDRTTRGNGHAAAPAKVEVLPPSGLPAVREPIPMPTPVIPVNRRGLPKVWRYEKELEDYARLERAAEGVYHARTKRVVAQNGLAEAHAELELAPQRAVAKRFDVEITIAQRQIALRQLWNDAAARERDEARREACAEVEAEAVKAELRRSIAENEAAAVKVRQDAPPRPRKRRGVNGAEKEAEEDEDEEEDEEPPAPLRAHLARTKKKRESKRYVDEQIGRIIARAGGMSRLTPDDIEEIDRLRDAEQSAGADIDLIGAADLEEEQS